MPISDLLIKKIKAKLLRFAFIWVPLFTIFSFLFDIMLNGIKSFNADLISTIVLTLFFIFIIWTLNIYVFYSKKMYNKREIVKFCINIFLVSCLAFLINFTNGDETCPPILVFSIIESLNLFIIITQKYIVKDIIQENLQSENATLKLNNMELLLLNSESKQEKLRNQLQPHFLFNALNVLKVLIKKDKTQAETYLLQLSDFLRYGLAHSQKNTVLLKDELDFSQNYLQMQKVRFGNYFKYSVFVHAETQINYKVPVFSIQLLLENALKHNILTEENPLFIEIYEDNKMICIKNSLSSTNLFNDSSLKGLDNLNMRYELLNNQSINITKESNSFAVCIPLLSLEII